MSLNSEELFSLVGKTAVLTGASGYLGRTMAEALLAFGARVVVLGRSEHLLRQADEWTKRYGNERVAAYRVPFDDGEMLDEVISMICGQELSVDILVNNAHQLDRSSGFNTPEGTLELMNSSQWSSHLDGGVWWAARLVQAFGDQLKSAHGSIINVSSMYGIVVPSPHLYAGTEKVNPPGYSAAKAALISFTKYVAAYWGEFGVRSNALLPGPFSNVNGETANSVDVADPFLDRLRDRTTLGRLGRPDELAGALVFLASSASSYVTGHALVVDGGWTIT